MNFELRNFDTSNWKEFKLKDLFEISKTKDSSKIKKEGTIPYVSRKRINNGVVGYKEVSNELLENNCLTIHAEWSENFVCFYHEGNFCADGKIVKLVNSKLNKYNGLFISSILSKIKTIDYKLNTILNTAIKLPINNNNELDWEYMENEVKSIYDSVYRDYFNEIINFKNLEIDTSKWKEFKLKNLFNKKNIKKISKTPNTDGNIPFVTSQSTNNGIKKYISSQNVEVYPKNCITISTNGNCFDCFYHNYEIVASTDVEVLYNDSLNKYIALFLCTILNKQSDKYNYDNKPKNGLVWETIIKLPVDDNGNPDWEYMERFIKLLPYSKYI